MKILVVQESDWLKKGPHDQHHLVEKLSLRGHEIRVIDFEIEWPKQSRRELRSRREVFSCISKIYDGGQVTVIRPGIIKLKIPGIDYLSLIFSHFKEIRRQIREFMLDVIVGLGILNNYLAMRSAGENNIPFVHYWLDVYHTLIPFKYFRFIGKVIEKKILKQSDVVLATNKRLRDRMIEMGAHPERASVLRHGVDFKRFNVDIVDRNQIRQQLGISPADVVVTFVGRLSRITGVREVASELAKLDIPHLKFLVVGTGTREEELRQSQQKLGLQERIIITGRRPFDEIPGLLAASDICLLPFFQTAMTQDIVPLKILDYMAMGKPVVSTRLQGMVEEFGYNNGVFYVDKPSDVLLKAMELADQGDLAEFGAKAKIFIAGNGWDNLTDELETTLTDAIREKRGKLPS